MERGGAVRLRAVDVATGPRLAPRGRMLHVAASLLAASSLALAAAPRAAAAEPIGPAVDISLGGGVFTGAIAEQARDTAILYRLGAGVSRGRWALLVSGHLHMLGELSEPRTTMPVSYLGGGVEPSLRRELTTGAGLRVHMRLGWGWRWLRGDREVQRLCDVHGGCDGGYWQETPTYAAHGPVLAFGVGYRVRTRSVWPAFGLELALAHHGLDRRGADPDLRDTFVSLGLNIAVGR